MIKIGLNRLISSYENVEKITCFIRERVDIKPKVGIICGSGLGKIADSMDNKTAIPYKDIPGFPQCTVAGHWGNLVFGQISGENVVAMQGRFHQYEGYSRHQFRFGPRFVPTSDAYNFNLRKLALDIAYEENIKDAVHEGVYGYIGGPSYESPAECKMMLKMGCDVLGMSTVPEVLLARHCGIKVLTISLVTNATILEVDNPVVAVHEEVLNIANKRVDLMVFWFEKIISRLQSVK